MTPGLPRIARHSSSGRADPGRSETHGATFRARRMISGSVLVSCEPRSRSPGLQGISRSTAMSAPATPAAEQADRRAEAERYLPGWTTGDLPEPPGGGWKLWVGLIGPGVVLAGTSIGSGEWLFGPAVTAQYGASLLWLALLSILLQAFCNLVMMRYAVYSGEPIIVGGLRTWPGPGLLDRALRRPRRRRDLALQRLQRGGSAGRGDPGPSAPDGRRDQGLVKALGFAVFLLCVRPLDLRRHGLPDAREDHDGQARAGAGLPVDHRGDDGLVACHPRVAAGFFRFGMVPLRAETIVLDRHFSLRGRRGAVARASCEGPGRRTVSRPATCSSPREPTEDRYNLRQPSEIPPLRFEARPRRPAGPGPRALATRGVLRADPVDR